MLRSLCLTAALLLSAATFRASAQTAPAAVKKAFATRYPTATAIEWEKEGANWEAEFKDGKTEMSAVFTAAGQFKEVEREVALTALPATVAPYINAHYPGQKIKEAARIEDAAGVVTWEAEVGKKDVLFDATGKFLREEGESAAESKEKDND
jgi:hypothetical protein